MDTVSNVDDWVFGLDEETVALDRVWKKKKRRRKATIMESHSGLNYLPHDWRLVFGCTDEKVCKMGDSFFLFFIDWKIRGNVLTTPESIKDPKIPDKLVNQWL